MQQCNVAVGDVRTFFFGAIRTVLLRLRSVGLGSLVLWQNHELRLQRMRVESSGYVK